MGIGPPYFRFLVVCKCPVDPRRLGKRDAVGMLMAGI